MDTSVKVMNLNVNIISKAELSGRIIEYLSNDYLNVLYFVSLGLVEKASEEDDLKHNLEAADLVLPGEKTILSLHHLEELEKSGMVTDYHIVRHLPSRVMKRVKSIYIVGETQEEIMCMARACHDVNSGIQVVGNYLMNGEQNDEAVINDINGHTPDVLFFAMKSPEQELWLEENKKKLNSKLCVAIGDIMPQILLDYKATPKWIEKMHLEHVYRFCLRFCKHIKKQNARIFRKKVEQYNNK